MYEPRKALRDRVYHAWSPSKMAGRRGGGVGVPVLSDLVDF